MRDGWDLEDQGQQRLTEWLRAQGREHGAPSPVEVRGKRPFAVNPRGWLSFLLPTQTHFAWPACVLNFF